MKKARGSPPAEKVEEGPQQLTLPQCLMAVGPPPRPVSVSSSENETTSEAPPTAVKSCPPPPPTPKKKEDSTPAASSQDNWLTLDKAAYNKFKYRLNSMDKEVKDLWQQLKSQGEVHEQKEFFKDIVDCKPKTCPENILKKYKTIVKRVETGEDGKWVSFKYLSDRDGFDVVMEYINSKNVLCRRNPQLPPDSKIQYPFNQQLQFVQATWSNKVISDDVQEQQAETSEDASMEYFLKEHEARQQARGSMDPKAAPSSCPPKHEPRTEEECKQQTEKSKVAIQAVRKCHSSWDRMKRDWQTVVKTSESCPNTQGSKLESDMKDLIASCSAIDQKIVDIESIFLSKSILTDDEIVSSCQHVQSMTAECKVGATKAQALRACFKA